MTETQQGVSRKNYLNALDKLNELPISVAESLTIILTTLEVQLLDSSFSAKQRAEIETMYRQACLLKEFCERSRKIIYAVT
ncbi:MAG TPA: hypothetical protein VH186_12305 [Chloroflexia bacterium]|nr:hypothetical protein [Chloroflexia bacterium]